MTRAEAREYLRGLDPEAIGVTPLPAKTRQVRFDRRAIDGALNQLSSITLDNAAASAQNSDASQLDELFG
jgi:hypothetical protein